jgi:cytosine/adenosine deaminase-related metal-dependent hydrolase
MSVTFIHKVHLLTVNASHDTFQNGAVAISGEDILFAGCADSDEALAFRGDAAKNGEIIDGEGGILMPGMVNAHTHAAMSVFRSLADDEPARLRRFIFPLEKKLVSPELCRIGSRYGIAEMLLGGVTTFCDMYYFEEEIAQAARSLHCRAFAGESIVNFPAPDAKEPYGGLAYCRAFIERWKDDPLVTPVVAPHAPYTNDAAHLQEAHHLAREYDVPLTMHLAEMPYESEQCKKESGLSPVAYVDSLGLLDEKFIGAHLIYVDNADIETIRKRGAGVSHNIGANAKSGKGLSPANEMYQKGVKIGIGTDGPMSGNTLDILTQLPLVAKIHKQRSGNLLLFPAKQLVEMATIGGARALGIAHKIGSIEKGKKADLVLLETASVNMQPLYDPYSVIVYSANPSNVDTVFVNGKIVVQHKRLVSADFAAIRSDFMYFTNSVLDTLPALETTAFYAKTKQT